VSPAKLGLLALSLFAMSATLGFQNCGPTRTPAEQDYQRFLDAVKRAPQEGWTPYWLGRSFTAGGETFEGPGVGGIGGTIEGGGINLWYVSTNSPVNLRAYVFSPAAWTAATAHNANGAPRGAESRTVTVASHSGTLYVSRYRNGEVLQLRLDVQIGDTTISFRAGREPDVNTNLNLNPLTDEATFLGVLQNLRPYPQ
jgi:hypothetical protein